MALKLNQPLFVNERDVVLRAKPDMSTKNAKNHLILGDYAAYANEEKGEWIKVKSRRDTGWLKKAWLSNQRILEINFVDIGQGDGCHIVTPDDEVILIDAGEGLGFAGKGGDNMHRFINWRYNLRRRKVKGVDGVKRNDPTATGPFEIDYVVISHPDLDHYLGFETLFNNKKLKFKKVAHNGIVEQPIPAGDKKKWMWDLGEKTPHAARQKQYYLWDTVRTDKDMKNLVKANPKPKKMYLKTLVAAKKNNSKVKFEFLEASQKYFDKFNARKDVTIEVLAPITESVSHNGTTKDCLIKLGNEGETKNGHSIVLKLHYGHLKVMLGGDLNTKSQDYLAQKYSGIETKMSTLEKSIHKIKEKLSDTTSNMSRSKREGLQQKLEEEQKLLELIITKTRGVFGSDIAKACHHGASDVLDSFLRAIFPIATVISSGDEESHSHPRPDALGAFGKASRGDRPLIFSTELARSSTEFSYPMKFFNLLKEMEKHRDAANTKAKKDHIQKRMDGLRDSNVARYGMITVRTNGSKVIIAQKLEKPRSEAQKWDIYDIEWNEKLEAFEYRAGGH